MNEWNANNVIYPADKHTLMMIRKFPHYHRFSHTQKNTIFPSVDYMQYRHNSNAQHSAHTTHIEVAI